MRSVCFAQNFGVRRLGAALACFSLDSFANQAVLLRSDFPSGRPRQGGPKRERARSHENRMLRPKLWSAAARRRFGLFLPGLICESSCLTAKRFPVRLTAARWAKARAGSIARRTVCFAQNFGVRRPGAALACFSLDSFANQAVLLRSDFPSVDRGVRWAKARAGSIAREPYASPKILECGGSAPLWPVSPWTHLRIKLSCCEAISRPVDRGVRWAKALSGQSGQRTPN